MAVPVGSTFGNWDVKESRKGYIIFQRDSLLKFQESRTCKEKLVKDDNGRSDEKNTCCAF